MQITPTAFEHLTPKEIIKGFHGRFIHTQHSTLAYWHIEADSVLPTHQHEHEQCTWVLEGELEMTIDGVTQVCRAGSFVVIPGHQPHGGRALTPCIVFDIFCPVREDYRV
jgi:quercetin dioxygenase-like cupin family protein